MSHAIRRLLGEKADYLLDHKSETIPASSLHLPGPDFVDRTFIPSNRSPRVLVSLQRLFSHGRLGGTGYLSILPVDQGVEHSAGAAFAQQPRLFRSENPSSGWRSREGVTLWPPLSASLASSREFSHKIPFIAKINHNELLTYPDKYDQILFGTVEEAYDHGRGGRGGDDLFRLGGIRPPDCRDAAAFSHAHDLGLANGALVLLAQSGLQDSQDNDITWPRT